MSLRDRADKFLCMLFHMTDGNMLRHRDIDEVWSRLGLHGFDDAIRAADHAVQNLIADRGEHPLVELVVPRSIRLTTDGLRYCR